MQSKDICIPIKKGVYIVQIFVLLTLLVFCVSAIFWIIGSLSQIVKIVLVIPAIVSILIIINAIKILWFKNGVIISDKGIINNFSVIKRDLITRNEIESIKIHKKWRFRFIDLKLKHIEKILDKQPFHKKLYTKILTDSMMPINIPYASIAYDFDKLFKILSDKIETKK